MLEDFAGSNTRHRSSGFTLIEMAIVILITGIVAAMLYFGITPALDSSRANAATKKMQRIELALLSYVIQNGCLPCPADGSLATTSGNAGWSYTKNAIYYGPGGPMNQGCSGTGVSCATVGGSGAGIQSAIAVVPWRSLGLTESDITDPWGDRISYVATSSLCTTAGTSMVRAPPASYPAGTLTVDNNSSIPQTTAAAYVLISYGPDRTFAYIAGTGNTYADSFGYASGDPQYTNSPTNATGGTSFRQDTPIFQHGHSYFDDIVLFRTAPDIVRDCGVNACGNPPI